MSHKEDKFTGVDPESALEIFRSAPTPYLVLAPDFTIIDANEARLAVTNTTREMIIGRNLFIAFPDNPDDNKATGVSNLRTSLETVLATKAAHRMPIQRYDIQLPSEEGLRFVERYWSPLNFPVLDPTGEVKFIIHQVEDVTEEVLSKKHVANVEALSSAIEAERSRLFSVFHQAPIGISLVRGPDLVIEFANRTYRKITGERRKLDGLPMATAFADIGPEAITHTYSAFQTGKTIIADDLKVTTDWDQTGKPFEKIFSVIWEPLIGPDGKPEGVITLAYDDTDKVRARLEVRRTLENLRQEQDLRERFVATLSHDLLTPLTAAKMSAQLLGRKAEDITAVRRFSERIISSLERCDQMIMDLLDANRIKAGEKLPIELTTCSLSQIIQETLEELSTVHGDRFILNAPVNPVEGLWSSSAIKRILENLCNNAVKYGLKDKRITVAIKEHGDTVSFTVQNWGNVISPDEQQHLFDLYKRAGSGKDTKEKGWGLGLTLVKGLTEAHQGKLSVESSIESGTVFTVILPR